MKPVIGVNGDLRREPEAIVRLKLSYVDAIRRAGGVPVVLPPQEPEDAAACLARVDGVVLTGGADIDVRESGVPLHASAELLEPRRQAFDLALAKAILDRPVPALGICLGMQMLCYAAGAPLHQHLPDAGLEGLLDHRAAHDVAIEPGSRLREALGAERATVVSHHHQAVARVPAPFRGVALSSDGVIEAVEAADRRFLVGVQWHPERSLDAPESRALFEAFVAAARENARSRS